MSTTAFVIPVSYRDRIYHQLDDCSRYPLIGVFGETGFNKTGLIDNWVCARGYRRLKLDGSDLAASDRSLADWIRSAPLQEDAPAGKENVRSWQLYVIISGYHKIGRDAAVHEDLTRLIEQNPADVRIIINDRILPPLALARLKAHHLYAQIDDNDFIYTAEETREYFNECCGLTLRESETETLWEFTSGWPAICTLISEYMHRNPETKAEMILAQPFLLIPDLSDYLYGEVFSKEEAPLQEFLLRTSLMIDLDPEIIGEFLDDPHSAETVSFLEQNRFYTITDEHGHCQCRSIFRAFLYHRFAQRNAAQISDQHCMLAELFQRRRLYIEAFCHAVAGNDYVLATSIVQRISDRYSAIQFINLIDGHLEQISADLHFSVTSLFLTRCFPEETLEEFIPLLKELLLLEEREQNRIRLADLQNRLGAIYFALGRIGPAADVLGASAVLAEQIGDDALLVCDLQLLADCHLITGDLKQSLQCAKRALFIAEEQSLFSMQIHTLEVLSRIALAQGQTDRSRRYLEEAMSLSEDEPFLSLWLYADLSALTLRENDPQEALRLAQKAENCIVPGSSGYDTASANLALSKACAQLGDHTKAGRCLEIAAANAKHCGALLHDILTWKKEYLEAQGRAADAESAKEELACLCREYDYTWSPWYEAQTGQDPAETGGPVLEIRTMGQFEVLYDHVPLKIRRSSSISLLQFLIVNRGQGVNREVIIDQIFPHESAEQSNHFNVALSVLRKSLEPDLRSGRDSKYILRQKQVYMLNEDEIVLDVNDLLDVCGRITDGDGPLDTGLTARFNALYRGDFMSDYPYEEFLEAERERIRRICLDTMRFIADHYRHSDTPARSIEYYERILQTEPYYEAVYLDYMDLLLSLRASHKARDVADKMVHFIEDELGAPAREQIEEIFRRYGSYYKRTGR